ncbi:MAG: TauD/TfdA dioxygenase family protein [Gammaproteobacteria bacterium]
MFAKKPLSPHIGLEISGVDLARPLSAADEDAVRAAWIEAGILLFRGGGTSNEAHLQLSRLFGELEPAATRKMNLDDNPYLMALIHKPGRVADNNVAYEIGGEPRLGYIPWHWDQSFMPTIVRGAVLRMVEPSARAGQTGFIDAIEAYARLPEALKARIDKLEVVYQFSTVKDHVWNRRYGVAEGTRVTEDAPDTEAIKAYCRFPPTVHPLVITQKETGRKVLKYSPLHSRYVLGMDRAESDALLNELAAHLTDERFAYFHTWQANDMIAWDNWRVVHTACGILPGDSRYGLRTTIMGDYDLGRYLDPKLDKRQGVVSYVD